MRESQAWREQFKSDLAAANRVLERSDQSTYCQSVAKCQQVVEKSIKMLVALLIDEGITPRASRPIDRGHLLTRHIALLRNMPNAAGQELPRHAATLLNGFRTGEIDALLRLAPSYPETGLLFNRNTEYPYNIHKEQNDWTAPSSQGNYSLKEVDRFLWLAQDVADKAERFYRAAKLKP